jgi:hypothetical protein
MKISAKTHGNGNAKFILERQTWPQKFTTSHIIKILRVRHWRASV